MRYREGESLQPLAHHASDDMIVGSTIYGLVLGIGFVYAGFRFKKFWLAFWGAGLSIVSVVCMWLMLR